MGTRAARLGERGRDARAHPAARLQKPFRNQLLVGVDHRAARDAQRSGEQPRGRQRVARHHLAAANGVPQRLRQLPAQVAGRALEHAERRNLDDAGASGHDSGSPQTIQTGSTE
ncbi:putative transcriptional regulator [Burkholderia pseudomallei]|nr:putative transcriptional regulator [Burkholderia pseudomallei]